VPNLLRPWSPGAPTGSYDGSINSSRHQEANLFKGLAHPVRIRVLEILAAAEEVPVQDLIAGTGLEASHLSQHLSVLRRYLLVESTRTGSQVRYRLASPLVADLLRVARELLAENLRTTERHLSTLDDAPPPPRPAAEARDSDRAADAVRR
jgi:ArsR family transcriptional regulator